MFADDQFLESSTEISTTWAYARFANVSMSTHSVASQGRLMSIVSLYGVDRGGDDDCMISRERRAIFSNNSKRANASSTFSPTTNAPWFWRTKQQQVGFSATAFAHSSAYKSAYSDIFYKLLASADTIGNRCDSSQKAMHVHKRVDGWKFSRNRKR